MSSLNRTLIKNISKSDLISLIKSCYSINRVKVLNSENQALYLDKKNYSIIVFESYLTNWTEVIFDFYNNVEEPRYFSKEDIN